MAARRWRTERPGRTEALPGPSRPPARCRVPGPLLRAGDRDGDRDGGAGGDDRGAAGVGVVRQPGAGSPGRSRISGPADAGPERSGWLAAPARFRRLADTGLPPPARHRAGPARSRRPPPSPAAVLAAMGPPLPARRHRPAAGSLVAPDRPTAHGPAWRRQSRRLSGLPAASSPSRPTRRH